MPDNQNPDQTAQNTDGQGNKPGDQQQQQQTQQPQNTQKPTVQQRTDAGQNNGQNDQNKGVLADLQRERTKRQTLETQVATIQAQLQAEQRRVQALAGVTPQSEEDQVIEQAKERLLKMFPVLGKLDEKTLERMLGVASSADQLTEVTNHHWQSHGKAMHDRVADTVSAATGFDLNDRQYRSLVRAYIAESEENPEFLKRHMQGDSKLIEEFAKGWVEDWFEPSRRTALTQEVNRQKRVPNGRDRNVTTTPPKKVDFKDSKAVEDALVESFKRHGGSFGD